MPVSRGGALLLERERHRERERHTERERLRLMSGLHTCADTRLGFCVWGQRRVGGRGDTHTHRVCRRRREAERDTHHTFGLRLARDDALVLVYLGLVDIGLQLPGAVLICEWTKPQSVKEHDN